MTFSDSGTLSQSELLMFQAKIEEQLLRRKLELYQPYPKQKQFHSLGKTKRERLFRAGNQLGKCVTYHTLIDMYDGYRKCAGELYQEGKEFFVWAWDGCEPVKAKARWALKKPAEQCFRIHLKNGRWIEVAGHHLILLNGEYVSVCTLLKSLHVPLVSTLESCRLVHGEDARHSFERPSGFRGDCPDCRRLYDGQLRCEEDNDQVSVPLQGGVLRHNYPLSGLGADYSKCTNNHPQEIGHLSSPDADRQNVGLSVEFLFGTSCNSSQHTIEKRLVPLPLSTAEVSDLRLESEVFQYPLIEPLCEGNQIVSYEPIAAQDIYDFTIEKYHNYITAGLVHHNSVAGGAEAAMHATGRYPDWWDGKRFDKANDGWASGVTGEVTRDTIQRLLIGAVGKEGTGFIPHKDIKEVINARGVAGLADTILVQHVRGGVSRIKLKYYEQGREKFQADTLQWAWNDEEPPDDIYMEILTRTNATGGILWTTFTPLLGMSTVVRRFLNEPSPDRADINMTISDVTHISEDEKLRIIASYPAHEREARINGKPMLGSGRIFPVSEELIKAPRFEVPQWYRKIGGIDFGWDHPTAAAKIAYNPDSDIIYLINVYKRSEAIPAIHASALKSWGNDLPWSWPHDGLQHDKGSGENLADQYRREGLAMLPERATFDDGSNGVEAGLMEMLTRMENGTFKVFDSCQLFFDEMLMYHRKEGKVVKEFDDVISACLHPDSEIITRNGIMRIADLVGTYGEVLSIDGYWQQYRNCRMTKKNAELVRVVFSDGHELLCTPDHKLLSSDNKWVEAINSKGMICHDAVSYSGYWKCRILNIKVLRVESVNQRSDVYCLEVPTTEAFALANGAIVHNCRYAIMMLRYSRPDSQKPAIGTKETSGHQSHYDPLTTDAARGL